MIEAQSDPACRFEVVVPPVTVIRRCSSRLTARRFASSSLMASSLARGVARSSADNSDNRRMIEQTEQGELDTEGITHLRDYLCTQQRVSAQQEEVVVDTQRCSSAKAWPGWPPDAAQLGCEQLRMSHRAKMFASVGAGSAARSIFPLAFKGKESRAHKDCGNHVLRQFAAQKIPQVLVRRLGSGFWHDIGE